MTTSGRTLTIADRRLHAVLRLAEDRRHLRAGVSGRRNDLRQVGSQRDRLGQTGRRAAADCDETVDAAFAHDLHRAVGDVHRRVHFGFREDAGRSPAEKRCGPLGAFALLRRRQRQGAPQVELFDLGGQFRQCASAEDDASRQALVDEAPHAAASPLA